MVRGNNTERELPGEQLSSLDILYALACARALRLRSRRLQLELQRMRRESDEACAMSRDAREFRRADAPGAELYL